MSLGRSPEHEDLFRSARALCEAQLSGDSVFRLLAKECHRLFGDDVFDDLFHTKGRRSIPPRIVAVVMVLQRLHGLSDREAVDAFAFDLRWKYAAGALDFDHRSFVHTVLVDMRERLRTSERPNRIFDAVLDVAKQAGLVGRKRVLDSTALYDAVATQDTVTLIRSSIRNLLRIVDAELEVELRAALKRDDDYRKPGKPVCDWDDESARVELVDALARDAHAVLALLHDRVLPNDVREAAQLVATVVGQDLEQDDDGKFRIAYRVAPDRVLSTADPEARHGHKTEARGFDGYKGHIAIDPDSEIITDTEVTAGNAGDASVAEKLLANELAQAEREMTTESDTPAAPIEAYGDASYGTADLVERLEQVGVEANVKVQSTPARAGKFSQDEFAIDSVAGTVRCPNDVLVPLRRNKDGSAHARFDAHCAKCPRRAECTDSKRGRLIRVHPKRDLLVRTRHRQSQPEFVARYRSTRPKVERKIAHLMRRRHGGRRVRMRGCERIRHDFHLLAASVNLVRLARLSLAA